MLIDKRDLENENPQNNLGKCCRGLLAPDAQKRFNSLFKGFTKIPEGYDIKYIHNRKEIAAKTKIIIGADGASSKLMRLISDDSLFLAQSLEEGLDGLQNIK